jgi:hypothetical protein
LLVLVGHAQVTLQGGEKEFVYSIDMTTLRRGLSLIA